MKIKIIDVLFAHAKYSTDYQSSEFIEWDRTPITPEDKLLFFTDYTLNYNQRFGNITKIGWLLESPLITSSSYQWIERNNRNFNYVLTHNKNLLDKGQNYIFCPTGGCWIKPEDQKIHKKDKLLSIISSGKRMTDGQNLRHNSIDILKDRIDVYGRGYSPIEYKLDALKSYMFSLTIENAKVDYYFTEKLIDCFMTGVVPIYWGCPSIGNFFNMDGIITFENERDLKEIVDNLSLENYLNRLNAIQENYEKAKEFLIAEDYIYKHLIKKYNLL